VRGGRPHPQHALEPDTLRGVPFLQPPDCAECTVALARAEIDSLRVGRPVRGFWRSVGLVLGVLVVAAIVACARFGGCEPAAAT
jgi:hypothetical protein